MRDKDKTKKQLIAELLELRNQNAPLKESRSSPVDLLRVRLCLAQFAISHSLEELLQATLDEVEAITGSTIGFYHCLEEDQRTLSLQAWSTNTLLNMCNTSAKGRHYDVAEAGVWVDCIHERRPVIHNDYSALKHRKGLPPGHAAALRELVVPVFRGDRIVAIVGTGNKPLDYDDEDVETVSVLADLAWDLVESKTAAEALRRSEEKYRSVVENVGIGIALMSPDMELLSLNKKMREAFPGTDVRDRPLCYKVQNNPPRDAVCPSCPAALTLIDGQVHEAVTDTPAGDRTINYRLISSPVKDRDGKVVAIVKMVEDITEQKRADEKFREASARLQTLIDSIPDMVVFKDTEGRHLVVNRAVEEFSGLSQEEAAGKTVEDLLPPDFAKACRQSDEMALKSRQPLRLEESYTDSSGAKAYFETLKAPILEGPDNVAGLVAISRNITERKKIEEALRDSELRLNEAQDIAHVGNWEWDISTNRVRWSDELYRIYGYEPGEISPDYRIVVDAMHPESKGEFLEAIDDALEGRGPFDIEYAFFRKDGSVAVLHSIGKVLFDNEGKPKRMVGTVQDISEQTRAREALRESEEKFRSIFDNANDGILIAEVSTRKFTLANRRICEMLGYSTEEIGCLAIEDIHPPEELPRVLEEFDKQTRREKTVAENLPVRRKDGSIFCADIGTRPVTLGGKRCAVGIFHDISGRIRMEEALRRSREFIRNVLDTVDEAFVVIDKDYRIILANKAYSGQALMPVEQIMGRHCYEISHHSDRPCFERGEECAVRNAFENGIPYTSMHKHTDRNGNTLYVESKSYPLKDADGNVTSAIEVINNITDRHLIEEQLLRTQKLEAVGLLAGGIAHDFNNLLMGIFGSVSMAKTFSENGSKPYEMLEVAEKALDQARNLTKQLLTFSKGGEPVKKVIHIPSVIRNSVKLALSGSIVTHVLSTAEDLWLVEADEGQIKQVMHNLIINAGEAMPEGGTVRIAARNVVIKGKNKLPLSHGKYVLITIGDTGTGISDSHLSRIFDPYFTTKQRGSGLGLTTSYSIIKKHGGMIDVKSELGSGSTFLVYMPASDERVLPERRHRKKSFHGKGRILLMDDEDVVRTVAGYMLTGLGYEAEFAEDGAEAIEKYTEAIEKGKPFDAVILDLTVRGGMGGRDAIRKLSEADPAIKAVVSSGYSEDSIMSNYEKYGFIAVLSKPYDKDELGRVLHSLLRDSEK